MTVDGSARRTFALFIDGAYRNNYHFPLITGVVDAARRFGVNPIIVCGAELDTPNRYNKHANILYRWVGAGAVDGFILAPTVFNYADPETRREFLQGLKPLPVVVMGMTEGASMNVSIDNAGGFRDMIRHVIRHHGYKRPAFVKGPENNIDAEERYVVYREVLAECGLEADPGLVAPGEFTYASGREAVRLFWDGRKKVPDVIIAANDSMAIGALDELTSRGLTVPDQVALTGFDDSDDAWGTDPPLTTVRQPVYEQAYKCVELLLAWIRGESAPKTVQLTTEPVYRRSCGCFSEAVRSVIAPESGAQAAESFKAAVSAVSVDTGALCGSVSGMSAELARAMAADLLSGKPKPQPEFLLCLESGLRKAELHMDHAMDWHVLISMIRRHFLPVVRRDPVMRDRAEEIWQAGHVSVSEALQQKRTVNKTREENVDVSFRRVAQSFVTTFNVEALMSAAAKSFPDLGVPECHVALYCDPKKPEGPVQLALSYSSDASAESGGRAKTYPSPNALIESLSASEKPRVLIVESLSFREERLGFLVLGIGSRLEQIEIDVPLCESLGSGLKGARLVDEVERRSRELEKTARSLRENRRMLLISEKMASLGRLTAGMAHEMNTPLAAVRAALSEAGRLAEELKASIGDAKVTADDYNEMAGELSASIDLAVKAADKLAAFIRSIKSQTRSTAGQEMRIFDTVAAVEDALLLTAHIQKQGKGRVTFSRSADSIPLLGVPGRFTQMAVNLVTNAVEACAPAGGDVEIRLEKKSDSVELNVSDRGRGISPENLTKVFDPMFSTKPFGDAAGLSLTIVHDIVTGEFEGTIDVESVVDQGTVFTVRLPCREPT
jgi:DNA-binding LacI/PurR family transcriptional regulator/signal transduction histidine kinase